MQQQDAAKKGSKYREQEKAVGGSSKWSYKKEGEERAVIGEIERLKYNELLLLVDTCQAESLYGKIYSPNIIAGASSKVGEDSLSHHDDPSIGVHVIDSWTYYILQYLEQVTQNSTHSLDDFFRGTSDYSLVRSTPTQRTDLFQRDPDKTPLTDFLGSVHTVHLQSESLPMMEQCHKCISRAAEDGQQQANAPLHYVSQMIFDQH
eukprot:gene10315-19013_t